MSGLITWIADFLQSIGDMISNLFNFLLNTITSLFDLVKVIPKFITYLTSTIGFLPSFVTVFAVGTVSVAVIYLILGRSTNE